jgi:hypothetical protein
MGCLTSHRGFKDFGISSRMNSVASETLVRFLEKKEHNQPYIVRNMYIFFYLPLLIN